LASAGAFLLTLGTSLAAAQQPQTVRVRGAIETVDNATMTVKGRDGTTVAVKLTPNLRIRSLEKKSLADVTRGSFVGITAMPQPDGTEKALEIHIFPEAMRGTGEGHRPWDLMPKSTMTNANVESVVVGLGERVLTLKYKDGEKTFSVPANVDVVMFVPGTVADLKPGERVFVAAKKLADGTLEPLFITVGRNGVNPPM